VLLSKSSTPVRQWIPDLFVDAARETVLPFLPSLAYPWEPSLLGELFAERTRLLPVIAVAEQRVGAHSRGRNHFAEGTRLLPRAPLPNNA
jgi:hypothetical protein